MGKVVGPASSDIGSSLIALQGAIERADFRDEDERRIFLKHWRDTLDESLRQKLLTWRANRV